MWCFMALYSLVLCCPLAKHVIEKWAKLLWNIDVEFSCFVGDRANEIHTGLNQEAEFSELHRVGPALQAFLNHYIPFKFTQGL